MQTLFHMPGRIRTASLAAVLVAVLTGCALPLASESELETESDKQFEKMRAELVVSNDVRTRAYINCISAAIISELERPYSDKEWDVEVFDSEDINAFAMPGGHIGV
ncbi:MAG: M48 family peptidase, partial [Gammaproteobacteria bacterium]|nr:M48 family peptidase [Gammaproteobacteria bacterium]